MENNNEVLLKVEHLCQYFKMGKKELKQFCRLGKEEEDFLKEQFTYGRLSARGCDKVLKVARTIADMDGEREILRRHLSEAVCYRKPEEGIE